MNHKIFPFYIYGYDYQSWCQNSELSLLIRKRLIQDEQKYPKGIPFYRMDIQVLSMKKIVLHVYDLTYGSHYFDAAKLTHKIEVNGLTKEEIALLKKHIAERKFAVAENIYEEQQEKKRKDAIKAIAKSL